VRKRLYIPQGAIDQAGLVGKVNLDCWILLDYIRRWPDCANIRRQKFDAVEYFWLDYRTACEELPLLFPRKPKLVTQVNKLTLLIRQLKTAGLLVTRRLGPRCYMRLTPLAIQLYASRDRRRGFDTSTHDTEIMESHDVHVTGSSDVGGPAYIYKEQIDKEPAVHQHLCSANIDQLSESIAQIFGRDKLATPELRKLQRQMPIPREEVVLIKGFYSLRADYQNFRLNRRRQSIRSLLEHWTEAVDQASYYFNEHSYAWEKGWGPIPKIRYLAANPHPTE
jgi:hypothetical protein